MDDVSYFNPLKNYNNEEGGAILSEILPNVGKEVCFVGDDTGYFFSMCRRLGNPSISFSDKKFYNFFGLFKKDMHFMKDMFQKYLSLYKQELLEHFEGRVYTEPHPYVQAFILFILTNSSLNINSDFSNFVKRDMFFFEGKIKSFTKYFIGSNNLYYKTQPEGCFVVSYEKDIPSHQGILISKREHSYHLVAETAEHKYYYREGSGFA